jgi:hypothetical protein
MKNIIIIFSIIAIAFSSNNVFAQSSSDNVLGLSVTVGLPIEVISGFSTFPINLGIALDKKLNDKWALEGQLNGASLTYDRADGIAHDGGYQAYATLSAGTRYYWNGANAKHPFYTNALIGGGLWFQEEYNADNVLTNKNSGTIILSSGTYVAINNKIILGLSFDTTTGDGLVQMFLSAKLGYNF